MVRQRCWLTRQESGGLWDVVREVIVKNYGLLEDEYIRDGYYMIRDMVEPMIGSRISQSQYDWLLTEQGYSSLRDDVWVSLEQKSGLTRPKEWPIAVYYDIGGKEVIDKFDRVNDQARGFIFVEKGGEAEKLSGLAKYGWVILAGKGYPERIVRRLLKEDTRPILALHDWDRDGAGIYRALGFETRRTKHLDIALGDRVTDLGLSEGDMKVLNLPTQPSPPKYKGELRVELSALSVLKARMGIATPTLAYVVAKMVKKGLTLSQTEVEKKDMLARHVRWALTEGLRGVVEEAVKFVLKRLEGDPLIDGLAVEGRLKDMEILAPGLTEKLEESALIQAGKTVWKYEEDFHEEALNLTVQPLIELLE